MEPFINLSDLTPRPGKLKCVWVRGADGRLQSIWVPDWESEWEHTDTAEEVAEPVRRAG